MLEKIEPMEFIEDDEIIRLFHERKREQEAFRLLVNKYKERLYWHIRKIVINHDDTDDLLQNVFVKIWQGLQEFRNDSKLYTWMYRIATNESLNFLNEKSRKVYGNSDEISVYLENTLESDTYFSGDKIQKEMCIRDRMGVVMRYEAGRKNRRVGKKLTLCEQRGELFSWGEALSAER